MDSSCFPKWALVLFDIDGCTMITKTISLKIAATACEGAVATTELAKVEHKVEILKLADSKPELNAFERAWSKSKRSEAIDVAKSDEQSCGYINIVSNEDSHPQSQSSDESFLGCMNGVDLATVSTPLKFITAPSDILQGEIRLIAEKQDAMNINVTTILAMMTKLHDEIDTRFPQKDRTKRRKRCKLRKRKSTDASCISDPIYTHIHPLMEPVTSHIQSTDYSDDGFYPNIVSTDPTPEPEPTPTSEPMPTAESTTASEPAPEPQPLHVPQPTPESLPRPTPEHQPTPEPLPRPTPEPLSTSTPEPQQTPEPMPELAQETTSETEPMPAPGPTPGTETTTDLGHDHVDDRLTPPMDTAARGTENLSFASPIRTISTDDVDISPNPKRRCIAPVTNVQLNIGPSRNPVLVDRLRYLKYKRLPYVKRFMLSVMDLVFSAEEMQTSNIEGGKLKYNGITVEKNKLSEHKLTAIYRQAAIEYGQNEDDL